MKLNRKNIVIFIIAFTLTNFGIVVHATDYTNRPYSGTDQNYIDVVDYQSIPGQVSVSEPDASNNITANKEMIVEQGCLSL